MEAIRKEFIGKCPADIFYDNIDYMAKIMLDHKIVFTGKTDELYLIIQDRVYKKATQIQESLAYHISSKQVADLIAEVLFEIVKESGDMRDGK